jgi:hypothetical protein
MEMWPVPTYADSVSNCEWTSRFYNSEIVNVKRAKDSSCRQTRLGVCLAQAGSIGIVTAGSGPGVVTAVAPNPTPDCASAR